MEIRQGNVAHAATHRASNLSGDDRRLSIFYLDVDACDLLLSMDDAINTIVDALSKNEGLWSTKEFAPLRKIAAKLTKITSDDDSDEEAPPPVAPVRNRSLTSSASEIPLEGTTLLQEAQNAYDAKMYDRAKELADKVLTNRPTSVTALRIRGRCAFNEGCYVDARRVLSDAQSLDYDADVQETLQKCIQQLKYQSSKKRDDETGKRPEKGETSQNPWSHALDDPSIMEGVANMLRDPKAMSAIQNSDLFKQMENMMRK